MLTGRDATGASAEVIDTTNCDREPIHIPGSIQPHGVLVLLAEPDRSVLQVSENSGELLGPSPAEVLGQPLERLLGADAARNIETSLARVRVQDTARPVLLRTVRSAGGGVERVFHALVHRTAGGLVLELELARADEPVIDIHTLVDAFTIEAEQAASTAELCQVVAAHTRRMTGFDRVLVYQFDEQWNGTVVGEDGNGRLPALLDHRFPASDIPAQARELYRINRTRIIPDAGYRPVPLTPAVSPATGKPLDMTFSTLRSVSPVHVEYMRNMETAASMSVSILRDGKLWGLISCHHAEPRSISFPARGACDLLARAFSLRLSALEHAQDYEHRLEVRSAYSRLLTLMAGRADFAAALAEQPEDLLTLAQAQGAAVLTEEGCLLFGQTPSEHQTRGLAGWLFQNVAQDVYSTDALPAVYPPAQAFKDRACGLLAAATSKLHPSYVLWFRPEVIQTIKWGGDPTRPAATNGERQWLHPRKSFETWSETVRDRALPWTPSAVDGAVELRNTLVGTVLRKAEELAALNAELTRSNKDLEAFSYSVSHDLRAPLRHIVGYAELLKEGGQGNRSARDDRCIDTIIESSEYAGRLVDKLLGFSRLGRAELQLAQVDMNALVGETRKDVMQDAAGRKITWQLAALPTVTADLMMLRMVVRDLFSNAVKYTRDRDEAVIAVNCREEGDEYVFSVQDNGVGFDMEYVDKLFGVFQRLHRWEDYEGTGIGLANVRRVIERHGGRTWALGEEGKGATFFFTLPKPPSE
jgi:light-regulated signal transduction histidine kinase (bacteriophytochrome)